MATAALIFSRRAAQRLQAQLDEAKAQCSKEHAGRCRAERRLRQAYDEKLNTDGGHFVQPIATVESCFPMCVGTPRQGYLAPATRARIAFAPSISPDAVDGLRSFSHIWVVF